MKTMTSVQGMFGERVVAASTMKRAGYVVCRGTKTEIGP